MSGRSSRGPPSIGGPATASAARAAEVLWAGTFTARRGGPSRATANEESMDKEQMRPVRANQATMWTLSADCKTVRLAVPPLRIVGFPKPLDVFMDFDAKSVDAILERLTILRSQMLPPLPAPGKRN
jgi:hypothetical protein